MKNDPTWKKFIFMTLVVIATAGILGVAGFYLWFVFPVQKINGLTYLRTSDLFIYYGLINLLDVVGVNLFAQALYFRWVKTARPVVFVTVPAGVQSGGSRLVALWTSYTCPPRPVTTRLNEVGPTCRSSIRIT